jgi:hypothetical protein
MKPTNQYEIFDTVLRYRGLCTFMFHDQSTEQWWNENYAGKQLDQSMEQWRNDN